MFQTVVMEFRLFLLDETLLNDSISLILSASNLLFSETQTNCKAYIVNHVFSDKKLFLMLFYLDQVAFDISCCCNLGYMCIAINVGQHLLCG